MTAPTEQGVMAKIISELKDIKERHLKDEEMQGK